MVKLVQYSDEEGSPPPVTKSESGQSGDADHARAIRGTASSDSNDASHPAANLSSATPISTPSRTVTSSSSPRIGSLTLGVKRSRTGNELRSTPETSGLRHQVEVASPDGSAVQESGDGSGAPVAESSSAAAARAAEKSLDRQGERLLELCAPPSRVARSGQTLEVGDSAREWGLGMEQRGEVDEALAAKLSHFHTLKAQGTHFNTSLQTSRAFRNPHIYAKLVRFVEINETGSNYAKMADIAGVRCAWDSNNPEVVRSGNKDRIAEQQKEASEARSIAQTPGKRSGIDFTSSSSRPSHAASQHSQTASGPRGSNGSSRGKELEAARRKAEQVRDRLAGIAGVGLQARPPAGERNYESSRSYKDRDRERDRDRDRLYTRR